VQHTVDRLCHDHPGLTKGLRILNIGFGLGIVRPHLQCPDRTRHSRPNQIDSMFQALPTPPAEHVIVEAHPDVLAHMEATGWMDKPGVTVLRGKWQDALTDPLLAAGDFDVVYTDTFSEDYAGQAPPCPCALPHADRRHPSAQAVLRARPRASRRPRRTLQLLPRPRRDECVVPRVLTSTKLTRADALFYDVYSKLSELHLAELGMDVAWADVRVADEDADGGRWGASRKYFTLPWYRLPVVSMGGDTE
jgi:protein arginine N-methyltransferase 2